MSIFDKFRRGGGGWMNGTTGTLNLEFTNEQLLAKDPEKRRAQQKKAKEQTELQLRVKVTITPDGATEGSSTTLFASAFGNQWEISKDGLTITPTTEAASLFEGADFDVLLRSLQNTDFPIDELPTGEGVEPMDFSALDGKRFKFGRLPRTDKWALEQVGKTYVDKTTGETRRSAAPSYLVVTDYYEGAAVAKASTATKSGKTNGATKDEVTIEDIATSALVNILGAAKKNTIKESDLKLEVTKWTTRAEGKDYKNQRGEIYEWLSETENLGSLATVKNGAITLNT